jgi:hypothetical protein
MAIRRESAFCAKENVVRVKAIRQWMNFFTFNNGKVV